jgi:hypothetical protein
MSKSSFCRAYQGDFCGWDAYFLENEYVRLAAVPDIGGRIMAYDLADYAYIYVEPELAGKLYSPEENQGDGSLGAWKNYGGAKTWPAPQGWDNDQQWHGPPDPVLDSGRYLVTDFGATEDEAAIEMVSPPDPRTGLQITRRLTLRRGSSRLFIDLSFTNISDRTTRWSIWDVTQVRAEQTGADGSLQPDTSCVVTAPLNPNSRHERGFSVMFGDEDNPQWQTETESGLFVGSYLNKVGKISIDSPGGWIAFANQNAGNAFVERFTVDASAEYPDDGATVECWTTGTGVVGNLNFEDNEIYHMETEVLSPLHTFEPGTRRSFQIEWGACKLPGRVMDAQAGGCTVEALRVRGAEGEERVQGAFGVFDHAEIKLIARDSDGVEKSHISLGRSSPLEPVTVDASLPLSSDVVVLELQAIAIADGQSRLVATVAVK